MSVEQLQEVTSNGGPPLPVDKHRGIIRGVRILGLQSANGRRYPRQTLERAISGGLYEDAKVNVNHPGPNPDAPRDYADRLGRIRNVRLDEGGLRGDLFFNPKHRFAEQLIWDAENAPQNVGFSHNADGKTRWSNGKQIVEAITRVHSVDLVADPATSRGLFEHTEHLDETAGDSDIPNRMEPQEFANRVLGKADRQAAEDFAGKIASRESDARYLDIHTGEII